jgi:hypothetical protein
MNPILSPEPLAHALCFFPGRRLMARKFRRDSHGEGQATARFQESQTSIPRPKMTASCHSAGCRCAATSVVGTRNGSQPPAPLRCVASTICDRLQSNLIMLSTPQCPRWSSAARSVLLPPATVHFFASSRPRMSAATNRFETGRDANQRGKIVVHQCALQLKSAFASPQRREARRNRHKRLISTPLGVGVFACRSHTTQLLSLWNL